MKKVKLNIELLKLSLRQKGYKQKDISEQLNVTEATVSAWINNNKLPDTNNLSKLCDLLGINVSQLVQIENTTTPQFKLPGTTKRKAYHDEIAEDIANCLQPFAKFISDNYINSRLTFKEPKNTYEYIQKAAQIIRSRIGVDNDKINSDKIISFINNELNTVIVPVLWGEKKHFAQAMILPIEDINFLYINIPSYSKDKKYWLLHEIAHLLTPTLKSDEIISEYFADNFATSVLCPIETTKLVYYQLNEAKSDIEKIKIIKDTADRIDINPYTVYKSIEFFNKEYKNLDILPNSSHLFSSNANNYTSINFHRFSITEFIEYSKTEFKTKFFSYLQAFLKNNNDLDKHYLRRLLNISVNDALVLYGELIKND